MLNQKALAAALSTQPVYIEDVFSTWLYTGNGSTQTITNGIDLAGEGGLVWQKARSITSSHYLTDTERGATNYLSSNLTAAEAVGNFVTSFNSDGFTEASGFSSGTTFASWTFRKAPKFFDIVTYTGNGSNRTIAHNLGAVPGCIIIKRTDTTADWQVYHRGITNTEYLVLNSTAAKATGTTRWNSTTPTASVFSLGTDTTVNASGGTYVAYLYAHNAGGFGESGSDNVISCGSFTTDGSGAASVTLGWEPQWLLMKISSSAGDDWKVLDNMRGLFAPSQNAALLKPNTSEQEYASAFPCYPNATGFTISGVPSSTTYIYIAIRRGPMKAPTSGASVFSPITRSGTGAAATVSSTIRPDAVLQNWRAGAYGSADHYIYDRLRGVQKSLFTNLTAAEATQTGAISAFDNTSYNIAGTSLNASGGTFIDYVFTRAPGFMDVVCDTGTGAAHTIAHNLGAVPELMIRKKRSAVDNWIVYANNDPTDYLILNSTAATADLDTMWNDTAPTSTVFTVGTNDDVNQSTGTFVTYLFATLPGVSKVGSYTGTGTTLQINCGFSGGARFVLIKRTDSTGDWYVWDTARGIVSGNDPYLLINTTAAEVTSTDYIDPYSPGFEISSTAPAAINASGGSFIFLAIA